MKTSGTSGPRTSLALCKIQIVSAMLFAISAGCSRPHAGAVNPDPHLVLLTKLYVDHLNMNSGEPPADEDSFKAFVREHGTYRLKTAGVENVDEIFQSTRDGQPLVIFYGKASDPRLQGTVVAHEQTGVAGKRCVGMRYGTVQLVDQEQFEQLTNAVR